MEKEVTVVVPAFNAEKHLHETLVSIQYQTVAPQEVIVVDDASSDQTVQIAKLHSSFMPLKLVKHQVNCGIGKTRNDGALQAKTGYIAFLSSDDCYLSHFIEKSLPFLNENTATYTVYHRCDEQLRLKSTFNPPEYSRESVVDWALRKNMYVNFSSVIIPKKIFEVAQFIPSLRHGEDLVFLLDTVIAGLEWRLIEEPLLYYRVHEKQGSYTQKPEEFEALWHFLRLRLKKLGVNDAAVEECYLRSRKRAFPPWHRKVVANVYHKIFGYR